MERVLQMSNVACAKLFLQPTFCKSANCISGVRKSRMVPKLAVATLQHNYIFGSNNPHRQCLRDAL